MLKIVIPTHVYVYIHNELLYQFITPYSVYTYQGMYTPYKECAVYITYVLVHPGLIANT